MRPLYACLLLCICLGTFAPLSAAVGTLHVIETIPSVGEELAVNEPIALYFDRPVNCDTAENAIFVSPEVVGSITCDATQAAVFFAPQQPLENATQYTLTLSNSLAGQDGARLETPYILTLRTTGFLSVTQVIPNDGTIDVQANSTITVLFNRPVVALVTSTDMAEVPQPLTITPALEGVGEWLNTSTYIYHPTELLIPGAAYTVTVRDDLQAVDGSQLAEPVTWSFTTIAPQIVNISPRDGDTGILLEPEITVYFNQPIDQTSVEEHFHLRSPEHIEYEGSFEWGEDNTYFTFSPNRRLELSTVYEVSVDAEQIGSQNGSAALTGQTNWTFTTVPYPAIIRTTPEDGAINADTGGASIFFSAPINEESLEGKVHVEPEPETIIYYYQWTALRVSFPARTNTTYTITVDSGIEDLYGNRIEDGYTFSYTTAPAAPALALHVPYRLGFYNAYNDDTAIYLTQRNVSRVGLRLYSLSIDDFVNTMFVYSEYVPDENMLVRAWELETVAREDGYTPSYVSMGDADSCPNAPVSRIHVGDSVRVADAAAPFNAFATPYDEQPQTMIYGDFPLNVVGGPTCFSDMWWWEVQLTSTTSVWVPEGSGEEYWLDVEQQAQTETVSVSEGDALAPGVYYLTAQNVDMPVDHRQTQTHFMMVMTSNVMLKASLNEVMIWATDVNSTEPIANAPITLYRTPPYGSPSESRNTIIAVGATDENGLWTVAVPTPADTYQTYIAVVQSDTHLGIGASSMADGIDPGMFGYRANFYPTQYQMYLYTDRLIYRPGQVVYFRGAIRSDDDLAYSVPDIQAIPVQITDSSGNILFSREVELTPFGTISGELDLGDDAPLGYYRVSIRIPGYFPNQSEGAEAGFSVAEYRLPEFSVAATPVEAQVVQNDTVEVDVASTYYFGGAVSAADVSYQVVAQPYFFRYTGEGRYSFYPTVDYYSYYNQNAEIANGTVTADARGIGRIEIPAALDDDLGRTFTIEATVTDQSQQTVSGRTQVIVHASEVYVGVGTERYIGLVDQPMTVNLITVDWDSVGVADQEVSVEIVEQRWYNVQEVDESGRTHWMWESEEIPIADEQITTGDDGRASTSFTPPNGGIFIIRAHVTDANGNTATSIRQVWVSSRQYVSWQQRNNNRIDLIADRDSYEAGDVAEIMITSPFQGEAQALITVERGSVIDYELVTLNSNSYVYRLPITAAYAPDVFVSVMIVKGVDENNPVAGFRMGLIQLQVDTAPRLLNVAITSDVEQAMPDATVTYTVEVTDFQGNPVEAEIGVALTDLASLSLVANNQPPLLDYFYMERGIGVRTSTPLTINTDELTQTAMEIIKGGGGGGVGFGVIEVREDFIDTAYWNATLVTNEAGIATFSVTLPDNLTTWRVDARALTAEPDGVLLVGQATHELISTRPLIVRPVTPRFFTLGDTAVLAAVVNNNTNEALDVEVGLRAAGITLESAETQIVHIEAHARARVEWSATVEDIGGVSLVFMAQAGEYQDASAPTISQGDMLPVYRYEVPEVVGTAGMLTDPGELVEGIALPRRFEVTQGEFTINLQTSLAATTLDGLRYLEDDYHDSSIEYVISLLLPNIITYRALEQLGVANAAMQNDLFGEVSYALQRLNAEQQADGGWTWCGYGPSNPLVTAYALIALTEAQTQGFEVRREVIAGAQRLVSGALVVPNLSQPNWMLNRQAFLLYALAYSGMPDVARTANLFEVRERLSLDARAFLALTLHLIDSDDTTRIDAIVSDFTNAAVMSATGVHWEDGYYDYWNWGSNTRTTALILMTLIKVDPDSLLLDDVVRWLMTIRGARGWSTTQETAWAIIAFTDWMVHTGELDPDYAYSVTMNGETLASENATSRNVRDTLTLRVQVDDLLADEINALVIEHGEGPGTLYYSAHLRVYLPVPEIEPLSRGVVVERRYVYFGEEDVPITEAHVGDTLQVRLTIVAPNDLYYVRIEDPLPAGAEAINPRLLTSQQIGTPPGINRLDPHRYGWGWWWFNNAEFHDERVVLYSSYLPAGTYEYVYSIQLGLAGVYNVIPATAQETYFPEVYGRSEGMAFTILPAPE